MLVWPDQLTYGTLEINRKYHLAISHTHTQTLYKHVGTCAALAVSVPNMILEDHSILFGFLDLKGII